MHALLTVRRLPNEFVATGVSESLLVVCSLRGKNKSSGHSSWERRSPTTNEGGKRQKSRQKYGRNNSRSCCILSTRCILETFGIPTCSAVCRACGCGATPKKLKSSSRCNASYASILHSPSSLKPTDSAAKTPMSGLQPGYASAIRSG